MITDHMKCFTELQQNGIYSMIFINDMYNKNICRPCLSFDILLESQYNIRNI